MARKPSTAYWWVAAVLALAGIALAAVAVTEIIQNSTTAISAPKRVLPAMQPSPSDEGDKGLISPMPTVTPEEAPFADIPESPIVEVRVPAVALTVAVSGETFPRETENCHGAVLCIDPPVPDQAAWYGATPATPSAGSVRLFGHTSWTNSDYVAFNDILAVKDGDEIIVTTEAGVFTYRASAPQLVPYSQVAQSQLIWGDGDDRLVLVTCNAAESSGTVVEAWLVSAVSR